MVLPLDQQEARLSETRAYLEDALATIPEIAVIAGTGLGDVVPPEAHLQTIPYTSIPHFPVSTVESHSGDLVRCRIGKRDVLLFRGRFHLYEGYTPADVGFPVRALAALGVQGLIITNAAGGLNPGFRAGDIMMLSDHINMTGANPLTGPHSPQWGDRFPDMSRVYSEQLRNGVRAAAARLGIALHEGVYVGVTGPCLETPAETRMFRLLGADAIGMSTVQEAIAAVQGGLNVLGFSVITNVNNPDDMQETTLDQVIGAAAAAAPRLCALVEAAVTDWPEAGRHVC
ncbi:MAG: purine-nucleoside phosphorylase [Lentisphaerae bacterium]|nr:purine-nucleoside phosphorylase [Lentisphaerota bacterium]MBT4816834.1 purine-nucleoside phosphorylase [Lentisphaerota bacterium]MBT5612096.1 purine-nucleoside phosphorylase [Lentisphaerota bacterium]MBT7060558.1 purine-nucleoside phosphorylase [Lentisphaerota bacterium]MBT7840677.1 purine-nucleoside phosphorylase [Lentisphaerota bacterium]